MACGYELCSGRYVARWVLTWYKCSIVGAYTTGVGCASGLLPVVQVSGGEPQCSFVVPGMGVWFTTEPVLAWLYNAVANCWQDWGTCGTAGGHFTLAGYHTDVVCYTSRDMLQVVRPGRLQQEQAQCNLTTLAGYNTDARDSLVQYGCRLGCCRAGGLHCLLAARNTLCVRCQSAMHVTDGWLGMVAVAVAALVVLARCVYCSVLQTRRGLHNSCTGQCVQACGARLLEWCQAGGLVFGWLK